MPVFILYCVVNDTYNFVVVDMMEQDRWIFCSVP